MNLPFPDALQEFRLTTSTQDAANTGHSGAAVNAVTKSGTNSFHGDAFWFIRNYDVDARDFFARAPDGLKRNQPGGTFGGPIMKDKLFFFLGYQGTFVRQIAHQQHRICTHARYVAGRLHYLCICGLPGYEYNAESAVCQQYDQSYLTESGRGQNF